MKITTKKTWAQPIMDKTDVFTDPTVDEYPSKVEKAKMAQTTTQIEKPTTDTEEPNSIIGLQVTERFPYHDADGRVLYEIISVEADDGSRLRLIACNDGGQYRLRTNNIRMEELSGHFEFGEICCPVVPYNLDILVAARRLIVTTCEWRAEELTRLGFAATCFPHEDAFAIDLDFSVFKGKDVIFDMSGTRSDMRPMFWVAGEIESDAASIRFLPISLLMDDQRSDEFRSGWIESQIASASPTSLAVFISDYRRSAVERFQKHIDQDLVSIGY